MFTVTACVFFQGQIYYAAKDKFVDEYAGTGLGAARSLVKPVEIPPGKYI